jgi:multidrug efflux system membrane fusion protein
MKRHRKLLFTSTAILLVSLTIVRIYGWDADDDEEDKKAAIAVPSRVSVQHGQTVITLDRSTQERMRLITAVLNSAAEHAEGIAFATILPTQALVALRNNYVAAQLQLEKAQARATVSRAAHQRLKSLYERDQDASQKSVQESEGVLRSDLATLSAAQQDLTLQKFAAQQNWGPAVAAWISGGSHKLDQVLSQEVLLVQVTLPPEDAFHTPQRVLLSTAERRFAQARYISPLPRTDPLMQRASLLYETNFRPDLAPGMNLIARFPKGPAQRGIVVPYPAIVWWDGQAWAYLLVNGTQFTRKQVNTDVPLSSGYFVIAGFKPGDRIVIRGSQFLLSEEYRSQIQPEG